LKTYCTSRLAACVTSALVIWITCLSVETLAEPGEPPPPVTISISPQQISTLKEAHIETYLKTAIFLAVQQGNSDVVSVLSASLVLTSLFNALFWPLVITALALAGRFCYLSYLDGEAMKMRSAEEKRRLTGETTHIEKMHKEELDKLTTEIGNFTLRIEEEKKKIQAEILEINSRSAKSNLKTEKEIAKLIEETSVISRRLEIDQQKHAVEQKIVEFRQAQRLAAGLLPQITDTATRDKFVTEVLTKMVLEK